MELLILGLLKNPGYRGNTNSIVTLKKFSVFQVGDPENQRTPAP